MPANTEKILSSVYAIRSMLETEKPAAVAAALDALTADLTDQMRRDAAAKAGRGNAEKIIRGVLRNADALRKGDDINPIKWQWTDAQGRQCVCDGFVAFRLVDALPLPPRPANAPKPVDLDKLFCKDVTHADYLDSLPLPDSADVRAFIRAERARKAADRARIAAAKKEGKEIKTAEIYFKWDFGKGRPMVNAQYLLDVMTVFPDAKRIYFRRGSDGLLRPLQIATPQGEAVIMPIAPKKDDPRRAAADELAADMNPDEFAALIS